MVFIYKDTLKQMLNERLYQLLLGSTWVIFNIFINAMC